MDQLRALPWKRVAFGMGGFLLFCVGFLLSNGAKPATGGRVIPPSADSTAFIRLVFVGSSACPYATSREVEKLVVELKHQLRDKAAEHGLRFVTTGVAIDERSSDGIEFLKRTGPYDEMVVGRGWMNLGADRYVWDEFPSYPTTPQLVITLNDVRFTGRSSQTAGLARDESVLYRARSLPEIASLGQSLDSNGNSIIDRALANN